jgi:hypothetical protein
MDEFDELIMDFALVLRFFLLFGDLPVEDFQELGFEEHLMESDEDLNDKFDDFRECILEPNSIRNGSLISNEFLLMKVDKVSEFLIQDFELLANKLFKQKNIPILVYIIKPVNVRANGPS